MDTHPLQTIEQVLQGIDSGNAEVILDAYADDAEGIDEVSRGWMRGRDQIAAYTRQLVADLDSCSSELVDVHEAIIGDAAVVTGILCQDYSLAGEAQSVRMPATFVLRRDSGHWRVLLFHALPIPE
ncbi:MAG: SgcJ/EcaC family oxidoreductase [Actinobacteria bacterium]|nr:MAG: SgcJ/EcaC family oxidoreductase [Actinomycetota bacterium]